MNEKLEALFTAANNGDLDAFKANFKTDILNTVDRDHNSFLITAVVAGKENIVRYLLTFNDIDLHIQGYLTGTALTYAIYSDRKPLIRLLLNKEKNFNNREHPGAMNWALLNDNTELFRELEKKGGNSMESGLNGIPESTYESDMAWKNSEPGTPTPFGHHHLANLKLSPFELKEHLTPQTSVSTLTTSETLFPARSFSNSSTDLFKQAGTPLPSTLSGIYDIAHLQYQAIDPKLKQVISDILIEGDITPDQLASIAKNIGLSEDRFSSLYILYCGLNTSRLKDETNIFNEIQHQLKTIHRSTSNEKFDATISMKCRSLLNLQDLSDSELNIKNEALTQAKKATLDSIIIERENPSDLTARYINSFFDDTMANSRLATTDETPDAPTPSLTQDIGHTDIRLMVPDTFWEDIAPLFSNSQKSVDELRHIVGAILFQKIEGESWTLMSPEVDPGKIYYYHKLWESSGILKDILEIAQNHKLFNPSNQNGI